MNSIKKQLIVFLITTGLSIIEIYWAVGNLIDKPSAKCLECSFVFDTLVNSLYTSIFMNLLFFLIKNIRSKAINGIIPFITVTTIWTLINHRFILDREASWSTYSRMEILQETILVSIIPVLIMSLLLFTLIRYLKLGYLYNKE